MWATAEREARRRGYGSSTGTCDGVDPGEVEAVIARLSMLQQRVVRLRFGRNQRATQRRVAQALRRSVQSVARIERTALRRLRRGSWDGWDEA